MITLQIVSVTLYQLALGLYIHWRILFNRWICMAYIYDGTKKKLSVMTARRRYHSSIMTSWTA